jgi:hypothetical protein
MSTETIQATEKQLAAAFTEWERRYRENPDKFWSEGHKLLKETSTSYGDECAPYFISILNEQQDTSGGLKVS